MRFAELDLIRYGLFEDCRLRFRPALQGDPDLHVIHGRNEAGKSTTLAAVTDLLFGFQTSTPYGFRFDNKLLRVGAVLERDGTRLEVRRRKSNKDSLVDAADSPVDEGPLLAWLHGQTRKAFELGSGLNHRQLRAGGQAILDAKDDVGQALFAAGSGLTGVHRVLEALDGEADMIWAKTRSQKRSYTRAEAGLVAALRLQRETEVRPRTWIDAKAELDRQDEQRRALETRQQSLRADLRRLNLVIRASPPARRRRELLAELDGATGVALPTDVETVVDAALPARSEGERARRATAALLEDAGTRLSALTLDSPVLARAEEIEALLESRGAVQKGLEDLPRRATELQIRDRERAELLRELGLADAVSGPALPSRIVVDRLRRLAGDMATGAATLATLRQSEAEAVGDRDRLRAELADASVPEDHARVQVAVGAALRLGDIDAVCAGHARSAEAAQTRRALAFERLSPWTGDTADLARLTPPSDPEIDAAVRALDEARASQTTEARTETELGEQTAQMLLEREHLSSGRAVSPDMVDGARQARDAVWNDLRAHLSGKARLGDPQAEASRYQALVTAADAVADQRYQSAEASGQLAALDHRAALLAVQAGQAQDRRKAAGGRESEAGAQWAERLAVAGLPDLPPARGRAWLLLRAEALAAAAAADDAVEAARGVETQRATVVSELHAALDAVAGPDARLSPILARAEAKAAAGEAQAAVFRLLKDRQKAADDTAATLGRRTAEAQRTVDGHRSAWTEALAETGMTLPPQDAEARLELLQQLRTADEAVTSLRHRIGAIEADRDRFETQVAELAAALDEPAGDRGAAARVDDLRGRLARGRSDAQAHAALSVEIDRHTAAIRAAEAAIGAAESQLAPAMVLAGAADAGALTAAVAASRQLRALHDGVREQERLISAVGELNPLLAACEAEDEEALTMRAGSLEAELSQLAEHLSLVAEKAGAARRTLEALEDGPGAADAAADAQAARAEMEAQAEVYLRKRSQHLVLRWAVDRYRERRQNPLLDRAGALFSRLTLGRYAGLRIDPDSGERLLGVCADGRTLLDVDAMSEGTRDQLYLSLRIAAVEQAVAAGVRLPFLADDLFINFDDERSRAGFEVLAELARSTQVFFFTHHQHLLPVVEAALGADIVTVCELSD